MKPTPDPSRRPRERRRGRDAGRHAGAGAGAAAAHHRLRRAPGRLRHRRGRHGRPVGGQGARGQVRRRSTNGDAGHQSEGGGALAKRRRAEAQEAGRRFGIAEYEVLDNHDGELMPTLAVRQQVIRRIRQWKADVVIAPRPNDYHPDHRYTGVLVQDAAYMVVVPNVTPDTPPLRKNPVFLYSYDHFQRPNPFRPDVAVAIDAVIEKKIDALDAHVSQVYEWLPWVDGALDSVPKDKAARLCVAAPAAQRPADLATSCARRCASGTGRRPRASRTPRPSRCASTAAARARPTCDGCSRSSIDAPPRGARGARRQSAPGSRGAVRAAEVRRTEELRS